MRQIFATTIVALAIFFGVANGRFIFNDGISHDVARRVPRAPQSSSSPPDASNSACPPGTILGPGTAAPGAPFWLESIKHQGKSPFNPNPQDYKVFRNVKDFGAVGDGIHDDTEAINAAISAHGTCGLNGCRSSTVSPAVIYFPSGTYRVSTPIFLIYYIQLIGDARNLPTIIAAPNFQGLAVIDPNPPIFGGARPFTAQTNFHRSIRNFIIDLQEVPADSETAGIHWQMSQATSLVNIVFEMSKAPNTAHQGIWMESGSGGFMGDLVFNGGKYGIWGGNQQFTVRNVTINDAQTAIHSDWNWGWTYQDLKISNCGIGLDIGHAEGALAITDATIINTLVFVRTLKASNGSLSTGSIVLNNIRLVNVPVAVGVANSDDVLLQGTTVPFIPGIIDTWAQGNVYKNTNDGELIQAGIRGVNRPGSLLDQSGNIVGRAHPQYEHYDVGQFVSVRDHGVVGDGVTDDTAALQSILDRFSACKIIFVDAGFYVITNTLKVPAGTRLVGEAWSVIAGRGSMFQDMSDPQIVVQVGEKGQKGITQITDIVFTMVGAAPGAIIVEWNAEDPDGVKGGSGMWDTHIRTAGFRGSNLESDACPKVTRSALAACQAAFLSLHITKDATGYFEGTWVWLADHDLDITGEEQLTTYSGRGILSESQGPVWMIGTASEHHVIYQYNLVGARDHYLGLIQTESGDPMPYAPVASAWALNVDHSHNILVYGAGLYSFFDNYSQDCITTRSCQHQTVNIDQESDVEIYSLSTVSTVNMLSMEAQGVVKAEDNLNGFVSSMSAWRKEK